MLVYLKFIFVYRQLIVRSECWWLKKYREETINKRVIDEAVAYEKLKVQWDSGTDSVIAKDLDLLHGGRNSTHPSTSCFSLFLDRHDSVENMKLDPSKVTKVQKIFLAFHDMNLVY